MSKFMNYFKTEAFPKLAHRANTFLYIFEHLSKLNRPVLIVETGCVRNLDTWAGEGQSTVLFDKFANFVPGSSVHSVDINADNTKLCKIIVSDKVNVHTSDSVLFLRNLVKNPPTNFKHIDLLYLDSYDVDFNNPHPSAMHHMKELIAISPLVSEETLVVIDDSPQSANYFIKDGQIVFASNPVTSGKAKYVAEYAVNVGATQCFAEYQVGWIGL